MCLLHGERYGGGGGGGGVVGLYSNYGIVDDIYQCLSDRTGQSWVSYQSEKVKLYSTDYRLTEFYPSLTLCLPAVSEKLIIVNIEQFPVVSHITRVTEIINILTEVISSRHTVGLVLQVLQGEGEL